MDRMDRFIRNLYQTPGVYQIYCVLSSRSLFREAENISEDFSNLYYDLEQGFCENEDLQEDYVLYGNDCFQFYPLDVSDEMKDPVKRKAKLEEFIEDWTPDADVY